MSRFSCKFPATTRSREKVSVRGSIMNIKRERETHFTGEGIAMDLMLGSLIIFRSVMDVNFLKLVSVSCNGNNGVSVDVQEPWMGHETNLKDRQKYLHAASFLYLLGTPAIVRCCGAFPWPVHDADGRGKHGSRYYFWSGICILLTTLCLSMWSGRKYGSNNNLSGSMLIGDCRRPLLHMFHTGFIRPQKPDNFWSMR